MTWSIKSPLKFFGFWPRVRCQVFWYGYFRSFNLAMYTGGHYSIDEISNPELVVLDWIKCSIGVGARSHIHFSCETRIREKRFRKSVRSRPRIGKRLLLQRRISPATVPTFSREQCICQIAKSFIPSRENVWYSNLLHCPQILTDDVITA